MILSATYSTRVNGRKRKISEEIYNFIHLMRLILDIQFKGARRNAGNGEVRRSVDEKIKSTMWWRRTFGYEFRDWLEDLITLCEVLVRDGWCDRLVDAYVEKHHFRRTLSSDIMRQVFDDTVEALPFYYGLMQKMKSMNAEAEKAAKRQYAKDLVADIGTVLGASPSSAVMLTVLMNRLRSLAKEKGSKDAARTVDKCIKLAEKRFDNCRVRADTDSDAEIMSKLSELAAEWKP